MASERIQRRIDRLLDQVDEEADQLNWPAVLEQRLWLGGGPRSLHVQTSEEQARLEPHYKVLQTVILTASAILR